MKNQSENELRSRRGFLKNTVKAGLAFTIVPRFVLGGNGFTAPSDQLTLGFIGTGKQARGLLNSFAGIAQIVAGADVHKAKLDLFHSLAEKKYAEMKDKTSYKGFTPYEDFREILKRKDIDAVVIATPDHWHAVNTVMAANAGKHVYCEKPLAHSVYEGRAMVNAIKKNNVILQTGSMQRSWKNFRHAVNLVRNGYVGDIKEVLVNVGTAAVPCNLPREPTPKTLNWDMWLGPAASRSFNDVLAPSVEQDIFPNWRLYKEYGGGMLSDWGAHMFDIAQWALDMDKTGPVKFTPPNSNDVKVLTMEYANGIILKHEDFGRKNAVRFIGTKGTLDISRSFIDSKPEIIATSEIKPDEKHVYLSDDHYTNWIDSIKSGKPPICDVETGHRTSSLCALANITYWMNKPLQWDPQNEQFKNDAEANRLLKSPMRKDWAI